MRINWVKMNRVAVVTCLFIVAIILQIGGCAHQIKKTDELLSWTYCGFISLVSNAQAEEQVVPKPDVGAMPLAEKVPVVLHRRCYLITARKWCLPCKKFDKEVLPNLGLTYGPGWDKDIMIISLDENYQWLVDNGFDVQNMYVPTFIFEKGGKKDRRDLKAKTTTKTGFLTKEQFLEEWNK